MGIVNLLKKLSNCRALKDSSGEMEMMFFELAYRVVYVTGLSFTDQDIKYVVYRSIVQFLCVLFIVGEVWFLVSDALNLEEVAACMNVIVIEIITMCKLKNMIDHKDVYKGIATAMESPYFDISTKKRKELVVSWAETHDRYLKLILFLGNCTLLMWHLYPLVDDLEYNLMVCVHLPFAYNTPLRYGITYIAVTVVFLYASYYVMVTDLIMQAYLLPLICQFTVLADCFENIRNECEVGFEDVPRDELARNKDFTDKYVKRLGDLVELHKATLKHTMELRKILSMPMLTQLAASGILICFVGYQATTTLMVSIIKCVMSLLYLGYNMFGLYIICRWCEEITIQSKNVGEALYRSRWETGLATIPGVRSTTTFVIARANKPLVFTAGGMYSLSLTSYTTLVKASYSALTVLLRFQNE